MSTFDLARFVEHRDDRKSVVSLIKVGETTAACGCWELAEVLAKYALESV